MAHKNFDYKSISVVDVIRRAGVSLEEQGQLLVACCPFHFEDTPSFKVYPNTNSWCCYGVGCGNGNGFNNGDAIEFLKQRYNYSYGEALKWMEKNFGHFSMFEPPPELPKMHVAKKVVAPELIIYWHNSLGDMREYFWDRGFKDKIINSEMWGWDGHRICIPVWEGEPGYSDCLGVRKRIVDNSEEPKYIGLKGANNPTVWGRSHCQSSDTILAFAGELDAARAVQDGLSSFSVVNGVNSILTFPDNWPELWFPNSKKLLIIFDRKEEVMAARTAQIWNKYKGGFLSARVYHWTGLVKDYCEFRNNFNLDLFKKDIKRQLGAVL